MRSKVKYDFDIGILGGGAAGLTIASGASQLGAKTLLIEKEKVLGGDCLHFGCVPSKTLIKSAKIYHYMKNAEVYGLPKPDILPVDFKRIAARIESVISKIQLHDSPERFCKLGTRVEFGAPEFVDEHSIRLNGKRFSAKSWVVATGSSPAVPPVNGLDKASYMTNKDIFSLDELPKSMIILGGGPIAIEMAQAFCRLGTKVYVIQRSGQILSKEDKDMADLIMDRMSREGVVFYLNSAVLSVKDHGSERELFFDSAGKRTSLRACAILVAQGRSANLSGLGLSHIGVDMDARGIKVDKRLRTTHKHLYAAGDVTGAYQFTHAAGYEGGVVISNAIFHLPKKADYTNLPWCTYTDPELASIGMNEKRALVAGIDYTVWTEEFEANDRGLAEGECVGKIKMLLDEKEKPIGVQILGPHAGELIGEWVAVMNAKVKLSTLGTSVHPYPTLGEINKRVAGSFLSSKIFSEKVKKGLKFFFNLKGRACVPEADFRSSSDGTR
jgi:pyruvate/2-oxoglutarate dehydrogenase complex dihydrolipoamide dehydrogenase (E3) component